MIRDRYTALHIGLIALMAFVAIVVVPDAGDAREEPATSVSRLLDRS
ncbi:MAG: hypothetical protein MK107_07315 [Oceanicola sp.]|nr:hypothetical protein [Oceanicola sp.]